MGKIAEGEVAAAEAELARRREQLINARSDAEKARLRLLRLTNPLLEGFWSRQLELRDEPKMLAQLEASAELRHPLEDPVTHVQLALRMRPDLNEARLQIKRGDLELVKTRNGLLPRLDFVLQLGKSGLADAFAESIGDITQDHYDALAGLNFEYPPLNRAARARHRAAVFTRSRAAEAVANLEQLVSLDVRTAYVEVERALAQVAATAATRRFGEQNFAAEQEKFRVGRTSSFLVAQAQRDLVASRIAQVQAVVNYMQALVEFYRLEGSLLERRGIKTPGAEPVDPNLPAGV